MHKSAEVLNSLLTINNDRIQGYKTAIDETTDADLKSLFSQFIQTSQSAKKELEAALRSKPAKDEESKIRDLMAKLG